MQNDCINEVDSKVPVNKDNITDIELENLDQKTIISIKNKEIEKLKQQNKDLMQENDDLITNFRTTSNILLERIKELEKENTGQRPITAKIVDSLQLRNLPKKGSNEELNPNK